MLLSVKSIARISVKVAMIEAGNGQRRDDDRADVPDEEHHDQRREQAAPEQVLLERRDRRVDEARVVGVDRQRDVRRQRLADRASFCLTAFGDLDGVLARRAPDVELHAPGCRRP